MIIMWLVIALLIISAITITPLALMWAVNILIPGAIPYTLWHWLAMLVLILILKRSVSVSK